jgi:hypothetical protein
VIVGARRQAELREDARHVLLHRAEGDEQPFRDRLVRASLRHQLEHLALARGELVEGIVAALAADELAHHGGVERRAAVGDAAYRGAELLEVRDAVLQQVADTFRARLEQGHRVSGLDVLRQQQHADAGITLANLACGLKPFVGVCGRHPDVHDRHVRPVHRDVPEQVVGRSGLSDDLEAGLLEQADDALPQQDRVVGDDDAACVAELGDRAAQRRKVARQAFGQHLVDVLGIRQPLQPMRAEVAGLDPRDERRGRRRQEHLTAVPGRGDAKGADHVEARVALLAEQRDTRVESHAHLDRHALRPAVVPYPALSRERRVERRVRLLEHGGELVTRRVDLSAAVRRYPVTQQPPYVGDQRGVVRSERLDELGRALHVGEQERDGAGRQ